MRITSLYDKWKKQALHSGFSPQGITVVKSVKILISLRNNEIGQRSLGKVIGMRPGNPSKECVQISTDKNRPLLVCPTNLALNGNGDICKSDVGTEVVMDAEDMFCSGIKESQVTESSSRMVFVAILSETSSSQTWKMTGSIKMADFFITSGMKEKRYRDIDVAVVILINTKTAGFVFIIFYISSWRIWNIRRRVI